MSWDDSSSSDSGWSDSSGNDSLGSKFGSFGNKFKFSKKKSFRGSSTLAKEYGDPCDLDPTLVTSPPKESTASFSATSVTLPEETRSTVSSLGWKSVADLSAYRFVVPIDLKHQPYFELSLEFSASASKPKIVYLNSPPTESNSGHRDGSFRNALPCEYPFGCTRKFSSPSDLNRHYIFVHTPGPVCFHCDYPQCVKSQRSFMRKDHYRAHYQDYHEEDVGEMENIRGVKKDSDAWKKAEKDWKEERRYDKTHWRCSTCLIKKTVQEGWTCESCDRPCEMDRIRARIGKIEARKEMEKLSMSTAESKCICE